MVECNKEYDKEANFEKKRLEKIAKRDSVLAMAETGELGKLDSSKHTRRSELYEIFRHSSSDSAFNAYSTPDANIKIIELIQK